MDRVVLGGLFLNNYRSACAVGHSNVMLLRQLACMFGLWSWQRMSGGSVAVSRMIAAAPPGSSRGLCRGRRLVQVWFIRLRWMFVQTVTAVTLTALVLTLSVFLYGAFYYVYVPVKAHEWPLHLRFRYKDNVVYLAQFVDPSVLALFAHVSIVRHIYSKLQWGDLYSAMIWVKKADAEHRCFSLWSFERWVEYRGLLESQIKVPNRCHCVLHKCHSSSLCKASALP